MKDSMDGRWRDVMTVVSGRGAHVLLLEAATVTRLLQKVVEVAALQVMSLLLLKMLVKALVQVFVLLLVLFLVMLLEEVMVALSSLSLFTSPPTLTTRPCRACLTQNISKAGDPDLGRGERTN